MANKDQMIAAAKVPPSKRTTEEARLVAEGQAYQEVRNEDFYAKQRER